MLAVCGWRPCCSLDSVDHNLKRIMDHRMMTDKSQTEEEIVQQVVDKVREGLILERTKEDLQKSRAGFLELYDEATAIHLEEAEKCGAEIGVMKMTAEFRFNKKLGAWEIVELHQRFPMDLPNLPIKRLQGVYIVPSSGGER